MKFHRPIKAIEQADLWYFARAKRNYTVEDHGYATEILMDSAEKEGLLAQLVDEGYFKTFSYQEASKRFASLFSGYLESLARLENSEYISGMLIEALHPGVKQEYVAPAIETLGKVKEFEKNIALRMGCSKGELSPEEMDNIFLGTFNGVKGFLSFSAEHLDRFPLISHAFMSRGNLSSHQAEFVQKAYRIVRDAALYQQAVILKDLSEKRE